jgi:TP901 family phage tail tape measure protein
MSAGAQIQAGKAVVKASIDDSQFGSKLVRMQAKFQAFASGIKSAAASMKSAGSSIATGGVIAGIPVALSVREFMRFDDAMRAVAGTSQASAEDLKLLTDNALELGKATSYTNAEVAGLQLELARAGFKPDEILASTKSILDLARATGTELPRAAEIGANVLRGFGLDVSEMGRVSDVAFASTAKSAQNIEDYFEAIKYVAPIAKQAGMSLEDVSGAIGKLADVGLKGSMGGTGIRSLILGMSNLTPAAAGVMDQLGVATKDAANNLRDPLEVLKEMKQAMDDLGWGSAEQIAAFQTVFDVRGGTAAMALSTMVDDSKRLTAELEKASGFAGDVATMMDAGIGGSWRKMMSAISDLGTRFGRAASGPVMQFLDGITKIANRLSEFVDKYPEVATIMIAISSGAILGGIALFTLGSALAVVGTVLSVMITAGSALATAFAAVGAPIIAIVAGVGILIGLATALAGAFAGLVAANLDWSKVLGSLGNVLESAIRDMREWKDGIFTLLDNGEWEKAAEMAALALALGLLRGIRVLIQEIDVLLFELLKSFAASMDQIVLMSAQLQTRMIVAIATGKFDPMESLIPLKSLDRRLIQAQRLVWGRLVELQEEADEIKDRRKRNAAKAGERNGETRPADEEALKLAQAREDKMAAIAEAARLQMEEDERRRKAEEAARYASEAARAVAERYATETAGTFSGRSALAPMRIQERQVELLTSIDSHLDRIESRPPIDALTYDE